MHDFSDRKKSSSRRTRLSDNDKGSAMDKCITKNDRKYFTEDDDLHLEYDRNKLSYTRNSLIMAKKNADSCLDNNHS